MHNDSSSHSNYSQNFIARASRRMRGDVTAGVLLVIAATLGFIAANSPLQNAYETLRDTRFGPEAIGLNLSVGEWASDGLLAIFFFMVGLELKREFVSGDLRNPRTALVPVAAAFGGVAIPALFYIAIAAGTPYTSGWAIPTATDIAFAVAVLGLVAPRISTGLRIFLLTLAVVDDLIAIGIIAVFFTTSLNLIALLLAIIPVVVYALLTRKFFHWFERSTFGPWLVLLPIGIMAWALIHASGIHATVAGVLLAFMVPVTGKKGERTAEIFEHRFTPLSAGIAVPVFAFFAAGVSISGEHRFPLDPIAIGIMFGLVFGKPVGIVLTTVLLTKFSSTRIAGNPTLRDLIGIGALAGVGFTVSLLVADLSFSDSVDQNTARLAVIVASLISIVIATLFLARRRPRAGTRVLSTLQDD
ncbi:MAG TPA: Na+/H+ antiporter NhaA [Microbacteriaceae bacterium]|nr:Na+/H+ antiporter NhaA [Microbacteriaceae bacterium]